MQRNVMRGAVIAGVAGVVWLAIVAGLQAGVLSGTIALVGEGGASITVKTRNGITQLFAIPKSAAVSLNEKKADGTALQVGQSVTVFTDNSNVVTRVIARTEASAPANTGTPNTPKKPASGSGTSTASKKKSTGSFTGSPDVKPADLAESPWPQYLGPNRDNKSLETGLLKRWPAGGPELLWTATGLGEGYSSVAIAKRLIFSMGNVDGAEQILAYNLDDGSPKWKARNGKSYSDGTGNGPRGTPTVNGDHVYGLGGNGDLSCVEIASGNVVWQKNILRDFGGSNITWGISESVFIDEDKVICTPGGSDAALVALNKKTGETVWTSQFRSKAGYASVVPIEVGGVRQYVQFTHEGTVGVRATDGKPLWTNKSSANGTANCSSPVVSGNYVFTASGYNTGGSLLRLSSRSGETTAEQVFFTKDMKNHHGGMVIHDSVLFGSNDPGILMCLDLKTAKPKWQSRNPGKGSLTFVDGMLVIRSESGPVTLAEANPNEYVELGRFEQPQKSSRNTWAYPVVAAGRLFLRDQDKLLCYKVAQ